MLGGSISFSHHVYQSATAMATMTPRPRSEIKERDLSPEALRRGYLRVGGSVWSFARSARRDSLGIGVVLGGGGG